MLDVFIVGCGDVGCRVAALEQARGATVTALARSEATVARMQALGITPVMGDLDRPATLKHLPVAGRVLYYFAPPPSHGDTDPRMCALVSSIPRDGLPAKVVYISTSGVYGNQDGRWVDEGAITRPQTLRGRRRLNAEQTLRGWGHTYNVPVVVLRVGGIYGPGRLPFAAVRDGRPMVREEEAGYTNRIHADDLAQVCVAAMDHGRADARYNVSDGCPGTMAQYFNAVADMLGVPRPPMLSLEEARRVLSPAMLSYLEESRRLDTRRMRAELCVTLAYPTLEEGLAACEPDDDSTTHSE